MNNTTAATTAEALKAERDRKVAEALVMALNGKSLFQIAIALGVTKEWLRTYAGLR
jgi:hypothetical protein